MTPDQFDTFIERIESTIEKKVNGKIDRLDKKIDDHNVRHEEHFVQVKQYMEKTDKHIEEVAPIIQAYQGGKVIGNALKWFSGVAIATAALWALISK